VSTKEPEAEVFSVQMRLASAINTSPATMTQIRTLFTTLHFARIYHLLVGVTSVPLIFEDERTRLTASLSGIVFHCSLFRATTGQDAASTHFSIRKQPIVSNRYSTPDV
jgi:hypothetical protein